MQEKESSFAGWSMSELQEAYETLSRRCQAFEAEIVEWKRGETERHRAEQLEALHIARQLSPYVVLLDIRLGRINGLDLMVSL